MAAILLATRLTAVMQSSGYFIFYNGDTPIQLSLPWQSHTPISVSTLKPPLSTIGVIPLELQVYFIVDISIYVTINILRLQQGVGLRV